MTARRVRQQRRIGQGSLMHIDDLMRKRVSDCFAGTLLLVFEFRRWALFSYCSVARKRLRSVVAFAIAECPPLSAWFNVLQLFHPFDFPVYSSF